MQGMVRRWRAHGFGWAVAIASDPAAMRRWATRPAVKRLPVRWAAIGPDGVRLKVDAPAAGVSLLGATLSLEVEDVVTTVRASVVAGDREQARGRCPKAHRRSRKPTPTPWLVGARR
jgi:hypothetical protein